MVVNPYQLHSAFFQMTQGAFALQEECGPLCRGVRGVDEACTPPKDKSNPVHKGLMRLANKVSPMRRRPFSNVSPYKAPFSLS